jgi:hypothetical protein
LEQESLQQVALLKATEDTETMQENIQDWIELDEGDHGFQLLKEEEITAMIFFYLFSSEMPMLLNCLFIYFISFFRVLGLSFAHLS